VLFTRQQHARCHWQLRTVLKAEQGHARNKLGKQAHSHTLENLCTNEPHVSPRLHQVPPVGSSRRSVACPRSTGVTSLDMPHDSCTTAAVIKPHTCMQLAELHARLMVSSQPLQPLQTTVVQLDQQLLLIACCSAI
jgi:hypothetical protein